MQKAFLFLCLLCLNSTAHSKTVGGRFAKNEIDFLVQTFAGSMFNEQELRTLFSSPNVRKLPQMVQLNVTKPVILRAETYAHFKNQSSLMRAQEFYQRHAPILRQAEERFLVDKEVILAILLIETNLGSFTGQHKLINIFPSVFVEAHRLASDTNIEGPMKARAQKKKIWAFEQINALLAMAKEHRIDIDSLRGSYAGAIGMCQFLPSSFMRFAVSARSKTANLFQAEDAILSVGNYLKGFGYKKGIRNAENRKAVYAYNHSDVYVDIVLQVAELLSEKKLGKRIFQPAQWRPKI